MFCNDINGVYTATKSTDLTNATNPNPMHLANPKKTIRMQFENISIHCKNGNTVESCEIIAAVAPSAGFLSLH